jgi:hypothetical protein
MRTLLIAIGAGLRACSAASASAPQERPYQQEQRSPSPPRAEPTRPMARPAQDHHAMEPNMGDERYGRWESEWGRRPPAPPGHWTRHGDWYRHVHACQARYRSYNPATDHYTVRRGVTARCRL